MGEEGVVPPSEKIRWKIAMEILCLSYKAWRQYQWLVCELRL